MQYALTRVLPDVPAGGVCAGIDWATADHAVCVAGMAGRVIDRFAAAHDKAGIATIITRLRRDKVTEVAVRSTLRAGVMGGRPHRSDDRHEQGRRLATACVRVGCCSAATGPPDLVHRRLLEELRQSLLVDVLRSIDLRHGGSMPRLVAGK